MKKIKIKNACKMTSYLLNCILRYANSTKAWKNLKGMHEIILITSFW